MLLYQLADWTQDMWSAIIGLFSFIPNWGFMIIVFTIILKLILSPLDYWQRKIARKNSLKQAQMQPELEKIQKRYGNNKQLLNQKTMELYKRENFSVMGSCLGMLVNMALTLFIFFTLFSGLTGMSNTEVVKQYQSVETEYNTQFKTVFEITDEDEDVVKTKIKQKQDLIFEQAVNDAMAEMGVTERNDKVYSKALEIIYKSTDELSDYYKLNQVQKSTATKYDKDIRQNFLWVKNMWRPDTSSSVYNDYDSYQKLANVYNSEEFKNELAAKTAGIEDKEQIKQITNELKTTYKNRFNTITYGINQKYNGVWNGYFILVVLAGVITYLSIKFSQMQSSKKNKQAPVQTSKAMGFMKFLLPALMIMFTIGYSAAFSLYIVTNSIMSTIISFVLLKIFEHQEKKNNKPGTITISPAASKNRPSYSREFLREDDK